MMTKKRLFRLVLITLAVAFVAIQFVPVARTNPAATGDLQAPAAVSAILKRSCYDCHSNATQWPWYARVAPASWLVAHDVEEGREHLNFSEWNDLEPRRRARMLEEIVEEVAEGQMPLGIYTFMHSSASLTADDIDVLREWAVSQGAEVDRGH